MTRAPRRLPVTSIHPGESANGDEGKATNQTVLRVLSARSRPSAPPFAPCSSRSLRNMLGDAMSREASLVAVRCTQSNRTNAPPDEQRSLGVA